MEKKLVLIDGHSILNRAYYGVPDLTNKEGLHTNAIYGFLNIMFKILEEEKPTHFLVAFDVKAPTFRHKMYDAYKGTRKPMQDELRQQVPVIKDVLRAMAVTVVEQAGIEADDILGTMARKAEAEGYKVSLVSGDRDLLQLATEKITIRIPKTSRGVTTVEDYRTEQVKEKYGVTPLQIIDLKGLMGDSSDNIPGVPGIGEKTAVKILAQFDSVENAIEHADEMPNNRAKNNLKEHADMARMSKALATIKTDCELNVSMDDTALNEMLTPEAFTLIQRLEFKGILSRFDVSASINEDVEKNFAIIESSNELDALFDELYLQKEVVVRAFLRAKTDSNEEDNGQFSLIDIKKDRLIGLAVAYGNEDKVAFIRTGKDLQESLIKPRLAKVFEKNIVVISNDIKSQLDFFQNENPDNYFDVGVAAYVVNPIQNAYSEEDLASSYASVNCPSYRQLFNKKDIGLAAQEQPEQLALYGCYTALVNLRAKRELEKELDETQSMDLFRKIEMPLVFTLYDMEQRGILVKKDALHQYGDKLYERICQLEKDIYVLAGEEFNINSPKQLGVILFEKMNLPFAKKTKTGYSTSAEVLEKLRLEDPIIDFVLEYRQLTKLKSTYADGLANYIDASDGRIHSTFNQTITATGRLSSTEPNLQNIPIRMELGRQIRKVFIPKEGFVFLDADYSQIELRVLAHMAGDERLIKAYGENADIHQTTAALVFHTPYDQVTSLQRRNAKAVNFGIIYGISGFGLSRDLNITKKEAEKYIRDYFNTYPQVKEFMDSLVEEGKEKGYVSSMFGRRRPIPELKSSNYMQRQFGERIAMNSPIQGTAADIIKIAMIRVNDCLKKEGLESNLILQIHDELLIETKKSEVAQVKMILQKKMEEAAQLAVPLVAEVMEGENWYEAK